MYNTKATASANTIKTAEYGAVVIFLATLVGFWMRDPSLMMVNFLTPILSLAAILLWFHRLGRFKIGDEDYAKAKHEMRASLALWIVFVAVQVLFLVYAIRTRR